MFGYPCRQNPARRQSANVDLIAKASGDVHTCVRAVAQLLGAQPREVLELAVRHTMLREPRNEHVVAQLKKTFSKLSELLRRSAVAMEEDNDLVCAVAMRKQDGTRYWVNC